MTAPPSASSAQVLIEFDPLSGNTNHTDSSGHVITKAETTGEDNPSTSITSTTLPVITDFTNTAHDPLPVTTNTDATPTTTGATPTVIDATPTLGHMIDTIPVQSHIQMNDHVTKATPCHRQTEAVPREHSSKKKKKKKKHKRHSSNQPSQKGHVTKGTSHMTSEQIGSEMSQIDSFLQSLRMGTFDPTQTTPILPTTATKPMETKVCIFRTLSGHPLPFRTPRTPIVRVWQRAMGASMCKFLTLHQQY